MKTKQEQIEEITSIIDSDICDKDCSNRCPYCGGLSSREAENIYNAGYRKVENVYIIVSPDGGIALNMYTGKGTVYNDKAKAEEALRRKNEWAKTKGYGIYELVELEVEYDKCNC